MWGRKINDLSYYSFQQMMLYKSAKAGKIYAKIGRFEPSSQICSSCGHQQKMALDERTYICPECGMVMDRDVNAAINIRNFAIRNILENTNGTSGINACGVGSSGRRGASCGGKTADCEAGKFPYII